jgi:hypothetical protein
MGEETEAQITQAMQKVPEHWKGSRHKNLNLGYYLEKTLPLWGPQFLQDYKERLVRMVPKGTFCSGVSIVL